MIKIIILLLLLLFVIFDEKCKINTIFDRDYNKLKMKYNNPIKTYMLNSNAKGTKLFQDEYLNPYAVFVIIELIWGIFNKIYRNLRIELYDDFFVIIYKDKQCRVIYDVENIKELQCRNKITTFTYHYCYLYSFKIRLKGNFAEELYDYINNIKNNRGIEKQI